MKTAALILVLVLGPAPAYAQFGRLGDIQRRADQAQRVSELSISDEEEREIGERVSAAVRSEFGVLQDPALTKYVSLVGRVVASASPRPDLAWEFIVLDTAGVNAFAAPGGLVHITKGALGLISSEAELAGVLGHEIAHITRKHTVNAIRKSKGTKLVTEEAGSRTSYWYSRLADAVYDNIVERGFDRGDENDADQEGARLANKAGYNPAGLTTFLQKLIDRNKDRKAGAPPNGLFATHPEARERIRRITDQIKSEKMTASALGEARYGASVKIEATPAAEIELAEAGARGVTGGDGGGSKAAPAKEEKKEEKKSGGMFGGLSGRLTGGKQKESTQASASAGGRAVDPTRPDRFSKGGTNPNAVAVKVPQAEIDAFRKGIA